MGTHPIFESDFDCLTECGADSLILEEKADNTVENFIESFEILKDNDLKEIILVTCKNHTPRAMYIFEAVRNHFNVNIHLRSKPSKDPSNLEKHLREEELKKMDYTPDLIFRYNIAKPSQEILAETISSLRRLVDECEK